MTREELLEFFQQKCPAARQTTTRRIGKILSKAFKGASPVLHRWNPGKTKIRRPGTAKYNLEWIEQPRRTTNINAEPIKLPMTKPLVKPVPARVVDDDIHLSMCFTRQDIEDMNATVVLGRGSYGTCYLGIFQGKPVTVKTFHGNGSRKNALTEFKAALMLRPSQHLARVYGITSKNVAHPSLVMPFYGVKIEGRMQTLTLATAMQQNWRDIVPWPQLINQVGDGLGAIHEMGFYHGDFKGNTFHNHITAVIRPNSR